jgi:putative chitinase
MSDFTFDFNETQLRMILLGNKEIPEWYQALYQILPQYDINTPKRVAAFLSQCGHESLNFTVLKENLNYNSSGLMRTWRSVFPTEEIAKQYQFKPEKIANRAYANRMGNGNEESGDGWKYSGKGIIQLTGHDNYLAFANSIGKDIQEIADYLVTKEGATSSACWFWTRSNLNPLADMDDMISITRRINGGTLGLHDRLFLYQKALSILNV